jgi:hypothetical protein
LTAEVPTSWKEMRRGGGAVFVPGGMGGSSSPLSCIGEKTSLAKEN